MEPNETELMADQGNWTVEDCILVRVASQVGSFAVERSHEDQIQFRGDLVMSLELEQGLLRGGISSCGDRLHRGLLPLNNAIFG